LVHMQQQTAQPPPPSALATAIGGPRGMVDNALPPLVFVLAFARFGLRPAVVTALAVAGVLLMVRAVRREPLRYAANGFAGVAISALFALWLGRAEGFFLPGIIVNAVYAAVFVGSIVVRKPLVGVVLGALRPGSRVGPVDGRMARVHMWATAGWAGVFATRAVVQGALYLAGRPGWLAASKIALGWPLTLIALGLTTAAVRRASPVDSRAPAGEPAVPLSPDRP